MRNFAGTWLALSIIVGCASAQQQSPDASPAPAGDVVLSADSSVDQILDALDARGDSLQDFTADVTLSDVDAATGGDTTRSGKIWMQRVSPDDARLRVLFGKPDKIEYALDKGWLLDRDYTRRLEVRRQVLKPGEKMDLLKLGEGPFPLPLGQDKADVHKMFEVKKFPQKAEDPKGTIHVQLIPKPGTQFESKFASIDVWADPQSKFPVKIETVDPNGTTIRTTELKSIKVNTGLSGPDFTLPKVDEKTWEIREKPFED
jgi:outer membrane lipoprotein-sorting protein